MFISPITAIENGWVTGIYDAKKQVQPNAIDFTVDRLFGINQNAQFTISEYGKVMRSTAEMAPVPCRRTKAEKGIDVSFWLLNDTIYDGMSDVYVDLPEGVAAMLVPRSTFSRNGIFLTSGLYDSGYKGHIGFLIHNRARGTSKIAQGTRIGQIIFVASESAGLYTGGWNHEVGTHYTEGGYQPTESNLNPLDPPKGD